MAFKVDLHTHTRYGSGCAYMDPADLAREARRIGLSAVCITEHDAAWDDDQLQELGADDGLVLLAGIEVSTELGEILTYGVRGLAGRGWPAAELQQRARRDGGYMVAAHPFRRFFLPGVRPDVEEALATPIFGLVDAVEVFNGTASTAEVRLAMQVVSRLGLPGVAGSDSHAPHTVGQCYTEFRRPIRTEDDLVRELRAGRFRAVHALLDLIY